MTSKFKHVKQLSKSLMKSVMKKIWSLNIVNGKWFLDFVNIIYVPGYVVLIQLLEKKNVFLYCVLLPNMRSLCLFHINIEFSYWDPAGTTSILKIKTDIDN